MPVCKEYEEELLFLRHWLHQYPELSMEETRTTQFIYDYLTNLGISCYKAGETGVIGTIMVNPSYQTIAIRSEIDGLPIEEATGLPFSSKIPGQMHACSHDAITAVNLCLAKVLAEHKELLTCNVRFLFEPGEETGQGAKHMISHGGLDDPKVDGLLIFHFGNQETRHIEIQKAITTAAVGGITLHVKGKASHWFQPQDGIDALYAASRLAVEIHHLNQTLKTKYPFVLGFGTLQAGTAGNIVADTAQLYGSLRAFTMEDFQFVWKELEAVMKKIEEETGAEITLEPGRMIPPFINDADLVKRGTAIGQKLIGAHFSLGEEPFLVGDNAAFYMEQVPGMRAVFLAKKPDQPNYPVHNPAFDLDESVLIDALEFLFHMVTEP